MMLSAPTGPLKFGAPTGPLKFCVIGSSGAGKSTFLNEIAGKNIFATSTSGQSCTQIGGEWEERNCRDIEISCGSKKHRLQLIDTPGFPDPDQSKAAAYYDYVVKKCNEPIHGVVFVMKPEKKIRDVLERHKTLLREFTALKVPLIVVMNGTEPNQKRKESEEEFAKRRAEGIADFRMLGLDIMYAAALHARDILVSYCMDDLEDLGKDLARILSSVNATASNMQTYEQLCDELEKCKDDAYAAEVIAKQEEQKIAKCKEDIRGIEAEIENLKYYAPIAGVLTILIPFVGEKTAQWFEEKVASKSARIKELHLEIGDAESAKLAEGNVEEFNRKVKERQEQFEQMKGYLGNLVGNGTKRQRMSK